MIVHDNENWTTALGSVALSLRRTSNSARISKTTRPASDRTCSSRTTTAVRFGHQYRGAEMPDRFPAHKSGMLAQYLLMTYEFRVEIMEICLHGTRVVPACPRFSWDTCTRTWPSSFKRAASPIRRSHLRTLTPRATPFVAGWHESSMHMCLMLYLLAYHWYREQVRPGY